MKCPGMNAKANLLRACRVFFQPLLGSRVPPDIIDKSKYIVQSLRAGSIDAEVLVDELLMLNVLVNEIVDENEDKVEDGYGLY